MHSEKKITPVFILDELQLANSHFLSDLHMLFNFVMDSENPFALFLCGLPQLSVKLSLGHHQVLSQRMIMRYRMQSLSREECRAYIDHHIRLAGARFPIFTDSALEAITTVSKGLAAPHQQPGNNEPRLRLPEGPEGDRRRGGASGIP